MCTIIPVAVEGAGITEFDSSDDSQPGRMQNHHEMSSYQSLQSQHNQQLIYGQSNRHSQHGMQQIISQPQQDHFDDNEPEFRVKFALIYKFIYRLSNYLIF